MQATVEGAEAVQADLETAKADLESLQAQLTTVTAEKDALSAQQSAAPASFYGGSSDPAPVAQQPPAAELQPVQAPTSVYYANCSEARAAGAAPLYSGSAGYRSGLDRDGDGVACEK